MSRSLRLLDSTIDIHAPQELLRRLAELFSLGDAHDSPAAIHVVHVGDGFAVTDDRDRLRARSAEHAVQLVVTCLNRMVIEQCRSPAFHAGVVARDGRAVALAAGSGTGKSTLVAALLIQGWQYASDEALVLQGEEGGIRPYLKPLSLHPWTLQRLGLPPVAEGLEERLVQPAELGATVVLGPLELRHVVTLRRAESVRLEPQTRPRAAADLLLHSFNHYRDPTLTYRAVSAATARAGGWILSVADPVDAAHLLTKALLEEERRR